jgi:hypothetical protein
MYHLPEIKTMSYQPFQSLQPVFYGWVDVSCPSVRKLTYAFAELPLTTTLLIVIGPL